MPLITRSQAAKEMGVTVQAVYGAIKEMDSEISKRF